jgi:hypothetical protein
MDEEEFAAKTRMWLEKRYFPKKKGFEIFGPRSGGPDITVEKNGKLILQGEAKLEDFYSIIGQAFYRCWEQHGKVPTFIAVPFCRMKRRNWDYREFLKLFKYSKVKIAVLVWYDNEEIRKYGSLRKSY